MARSNVTPVAPALAWAPSVRNFSISSTLLNQDDSRFDATTYATEGYLALDTLSKSRYQKVPLGLLVGRVYHPTESQPRSNFKRIWVKRGFGPAFLTGKQLFFFRPDRDKFISTSMPKIGELRIPQNTILLSRSGTTGFPVLVGRWLSQFAITDDAIRIFPGSAPVGFVYAFLASSIGRPLMVKSEYGSTIPHLEAKHINTVPVPLLPESLQLSIHEKITAAYMLRDDANLILDEADEKLHHLLGVSPFTEEDIEFINGSHDVRAFSVSSAELGDRLDASNHIPVVRSAIHKLRQGKFELVRVGELCSRVVIPARFKRNYAEVEKGTPYLLPSLLPMIRYFGIKGISEIQAQECPEYLLREGQLLISTDGTVGRLHPVTRRIVGWFGSNNIARLSDDQTDMGFLYAFLVTPFGQHQLLKEIYGGVIDHINEIHIKTVLAPNLPREEQKEIGDLVRCAFEKKDTANDLEDEAVTELEDALRQR